MAEVSRLPVSEQTDIRAGESSQGQVDERLERCAIELWAVDNRVRGVGEDNWDALGWGDRRDYRLMAAAVLRVVGVFAPSEDVIHFAAAPPNDEDRSNAF